MPSSSTQRSSAGAQSKLLTTSGIAEPSKEHSGDRAHYAGADLASQAAVLAHGVAESQAFIDANKRLALVCMLTFLEVNGFRVDASDPELADWILAFAAGKTAEEIAPNVREAMRSLG